eukprot:11210600-Lingulodinium_polyedra.AAC.1
MPDAPVSAALRGPCNHVSLNLHVRNVLMNPGFVECRLHLINLAMGCNGSRGGHLARGNTIPH